MNKKTKKISVNIGGNGNHYVREDGVLLGGFMYFENAKIFYNAYCEANKSNFNFEIILIGFIDSINNN